MNGGLRAAVRVDRLRLSQGTFMPLTIPQLLREMHRLRRHIRELREEIDLAPKVLKAHEQKVTRRQDALREAQEAIKKLKAQVGQKELDLKTTGQQLKKYEKQLNESANKKEYDALQSEIVHTQGQRQKQEEEALAAMMEVDERTAKLPEFEAQLQQAKDELKSYQQEIEVRVQRLKDEMANAQKELGEAEGQLPALIRPLVERLVKAFGPDAFAGVKERTCQQCHTSITEQHHNELRAGRFVTCKNCARGLYLVE
jgi:uncharacterized protein